MRPWVVIRISFSFIGVSAFGFSTLWYLSIYIPPQQKPQQTLLLHFAFQHLFLFLFRSKETEPQNIKRVEVTCFALTEVSRSATTHSLSLSWWDLDGGTERLGNGSSGGFYTMWKRRRGKRLTKKPEEVCMALRSRSYRRRYRSFLGAYMGPVIPRLSPIERKVIFIYSFTSKGVFLSI